MKKRRLLKFLIPFLTFVCISIIINYYFYKTQVVNYEPDYTGTTLIDYAFSPIITDIYLDGEKYLIAEQDNIKYYYSSQNFSLYFNSYDDADTSEVYKKYSFADVLKYSMISFDEILSKADTVSNNVYKYQEFNIIVCDNSDVVIGEATIDNTVCN